MSDTDRNYGLLSETSGIGETRDPQLRRNLPMAAGLSWLRAGWRDFKAAAVPSVIYGVVMASLSIGFVWVLVALGYVYILFPALAGFMIVAPFLAIGLYEQSRSLERGHAIGLKTMLTARPRAGAQVFFAGLLLCLLLLLWMRAAVLLYALFFGVVPFPGMNHVLQLLLGSPYGWTMLAVGTAIGGLFAAFSFSISVFAMPMMLDQKVDALTAMGSSMRFVWNNLPAMLAWGAIVLVSFVVCVATGLVAMVVIFPLLGYATWHAYRAIVRPHG